MHWSTGDPFPQWVAVGLQSRLPPAVPPVPPVTLPPVPLVAPPIPPLPLVLPVAPPAPPETLPPAPFESPLLPAWERSAALWSLPHAPFSAATTVAPANVPIAERMAHSFPSMPGASARDARPSAHRRSRREDSFAHSSWKAGIERRRCDPMRRSSSPIQPLDIRRQKRSLIRSSSRKRSGPNTRPSIRNLLGTSSRSRR